MSAQRLLGRWLVLLSAAACAAAPCAAAVHKCTDARARVTYQDEPCAAGDQREKVDTGDAVTTRRTAPATAAQPRASAPSITRSLPAGVAAPASAPALKGPTPETGKPRR